MSVITLRRDGQCTECGTPLKAGDKARWYRNGDLYGMGCHERPEGESLPAPVKIPAKRGDLVSLLAGALKEADDAAKAAYDAFCKTHYAQPAFAVVENAKGDLFSDPKKPERVVGLMADVCGFVWMDVSFKEGKRLIADFKREGRPIDARPGRDSKEWELTVAERKFTLHYRKSHSVWSSPWSLDAPAVGYGNGTMSAAEAAGSAFIRHMDERGYPGLDCRSMMD